MSQKWIRRVIGGLSFTSALFIFQACYGTPQDIEPDFLIEGEVLSKETGAPIDGIKVNLPYTLQQQFTDTNGRFSMYTPFRDSVKIEFQDTDSIENGHYKPLDTTLTQIHDKVFVKIKLETF